MRQWCIPCHPRQLQMKLPGQANRRAAPILLYSLTFAFDQPAQTIQIFGLGSLTRQAHQRAFSQAPCMQSLPRLLPIGRRDTRPVIGSQHHDLLKRQLRQDPPHIRTTDAKHLAQAIFGEAAVRIDALFKNRVEQSRIQLFSRIPLARKGQGGRVRLQR